MAAPVGEIEAPCEAVDLAAFDAQNAAVLCADATLSVTEDGGATWAAVQPEIMPAAIGLAGEGYVLAGAGDSCEGVAVSVVETSGAPVEEPTCRDVEGSDDSELAVAAAGGALWLWVGEDVPMPTEVTVDGDRSVTVASHGRHLLLLTDDDRAGRAWLATVPRPTL